MSKPPRVSAKAKKKKCFGRPRKYTREFLLSVPVKLRAGKSLEQIAKEVDGKVSVIIELCHKFSVPLPSSKRLRTFVRLKYKTAQRIHERAVEMGITYNELAERLLEVIARDGMFTAVLDD